MAVHIKELDLKSMAESTMHKVWEQAYRNYLRTQCVITSYDLERARLHADDVVSSVRKCYHASSSS